MSSGPAEIAEVFRRRDDDSCIPPLRADAFGDSPTVTLSCSTGEAESLIKDAGGSTIVIGTRRRFGVGEGCSVESKVAST